MKLVLSDYIAAMKEDGELDTFIANLLRELDILPLTIPQRGRQHGVDIAAVGPDFDDQHNQRTLFLFVIKQGDLNRANWNTGVNAVRPTLDEIKDVYIPTSIPIQFRNLPIKIIVATNGFLGQNVNMDWVGYTTGNTATNRQYDFWGIDKLILIAEKAQFSESLFPAPVQSLLRKALALLDVPEYDYAHFYQLLDELLAVQDTTPSVKETIKRIRLVNACLSIVLYWSDGFNNMKPPLLLSERAVLNTWNWLQKIKLSKDGEVVREYVSMLSFKSDIDLKYFVKIKDAVLVHEGLAYTGQMDHTEYCLTTFEQIGIISNMALYKIWFAQTFSFIQEQDFDPSQAAYEDADAIADYLVRLIENNPSSLYPRFDEHCIEINLALLVLFHTGRKAAAIKWLGSLVNYLSLNHQLLGFFPLWITDYEKLAEAVATRDNPAPESSMLLTVLAEWSLILKQYDIYYNTRYVAGQLKDINLQLWRPGTETENFLYTQNAMHGSGDSKVSILLHERYLDYLMEMTEERDTWMEEKGISCITEGFFIIACIAFRHFRTYMFPSLWRTALSPSFCFNAPEIVQAKEGQG